MTGSELKTIVDGLTNDSMSEATFLALLNAAKDGIESQRAWEFLKKLDSSKTVAAGTTSSTTFALPTDFARPLRLSVGSDTSYRPLVGLEDSRILRNDPGAYFINWASETFSFTGTEGTGGTVYLLYQRFSPDITTSTEPVWPDRFQRLLAYDIAKQWFAQNAGEREYSWANEMGAEAKRLLDAMILWDERIKAQQANSAGTPADTSNAAYIV